jgi:flagellar motor protein MotB
MTDALFALIPISEADLATLAGARAQAVQDYLSQTGKVAAKRLFLTAKASELNTNGTRAYLKFR